MAEDLSSLQHVRGLVKWFDPAKGYGFIVCPDNGPDILLHVNVLRNFGQSSIADGAGIEVVTHRTDRGVQAVEIVSITPPEREDTPVLSDLAQLDDEEISNTPLEPARVMGSKSQRVGFANVFGRDENLHVEVLRQSGLPDVQSGEASPCGRRQARTNGRCARLEAASSDVDYIDRCVEWLHVSQPPPLACGDLRPYGGL